MGQRSGLKFEIKMADSKKEFGDFQTPLDLAKDLCQLLSSRGIAPKFIIEPTCGLGSFIKASEIIFEKSTKIIGVEINGEYVNKAKAMIKNRRNTSVSKGNFFDFLWEVTLLGLHGPILFLGNPPWVTNSEMSVIAGSNTPSKNNLGKLKGIQAITGKSNFDISEVMVSRQCELLKDRTGWIAVLVKKSVAHKILKKLWTENFNIGRSAIYDIDTKKHFGANVDSCFMILSFGDKERSLECDVFRGIYDNKPQSVISLVGDIVVSNLELFNENKAFLGKSKRFLWRSGIKHDCSKVMELKGNKEGIINGLGEYVFIENTHVFPMFKSSDIAKGLKRTNRFMIVPQKFIGEDTGKIQRVAPRLWDYLMSHREKLAKRKSSIYKNKPEFSIFGVGDYSFSRWKVAVSSMYKKIEFRKIGPQDEYPCVFDDTVYFLPAKSEEEADFILALVRSEPFQELLTAMTFEHDKRIVSAEKLNRISLEKIASHLS